MVVEKEETKKRLLSESVANFEGQTVTMYSNCAKIDGCLICRGFPDKERMMQQFRKLALLRNSTITRLDAG